MIDRNHTMNQVSAPYDRLTPEHDWQDCPYNRIGTDLISVNINQIRTKTLTKLFSNEVI